MLDVPSDCGCVAAAANKVPATTSKGGTTEPQADARKPDEPPSDGVDTLYHSAMANRGMEPQHKSRYASISLYICETLAKNPASTCTAAYNDVPAPIDDASYARLLEAGLDPMLARHIAHLFSRDPLVIFRQRVSELSDEKSTEHFENFQSTNWQTVRWKPPPMASKSLGGDADIGWRVEFRSMEVPLPRPRGGAPPGSRLSSA